MTKIKPIHFALSSENKPYVIDDKGRLWIYNNANWHMVVELPEDPDPNASNVTGV